MGAENWQMKFLTGKYKIIRAEEWCIIPIILEDDEFPKLQSHLEHAAGHHYKRYTTDSVLVPLKDQN
jgi:hypothetical protein